MTLVVECTVLALTDVWTGERDPDDVLRSREVRVSGPSRDDLQEAIALLKSKDFGVQLQFGNYR